MKISFFRATIALSTTALLSGCATTGNQNSILSAIGGGVAGYALCQLTNANDTECAALMVAGAVGGGLIGREMDRRDQERRNIAMAQMLENQGQQTVQWTNPETSNTGQIEPLNTYRDAQGNTCHDVNETYQRDGRTINDSYTVCTTPSGETFAR